MSGNESGNCKQTDVSRTSYASYAEQRRHARKFYHEFYVADRQYYDADLVWRYLFVGAPVRLERDETNTERPHAVAVLFEVTKEIQNQSVSISEDGDWAIQKHVLPSVESGSYLLGYVSSSPREEDLADILELGWDDDQAFFNCRISGIEEDAAADQQIKVGVWIERKKNTK
ncbi:MAG: hypothetical protein IJ764_01235 [Bacteroidales bacterium]|nr:hypothetical protein [Bacteroidales bacterium]